MHLDDQLIQNILNGDESSFSVLVEKYQNHIYSICISILKNPNEAEEAAQDTFIKIYKNLSKYNGESKFTTWTYKIAYRTSLDYIRKRKHTTSLDDVEFGMEASGDLSDSNIQKNELSKLIQKAITHLATDEAAIIKLFYLDEMNINEVVEVTGFTKSNVKVKLFRGRKKLSDIITNQFPELANYLEL